ncbi:hypothetical protein CTAYLR_004331 [Chrysophaeum taylorii]|uniref:FAD-binding domain-containing protein n=1 Tax=Chrysophaeum taylorii TaxID=2483200 RepID=A0AAD7XMU8_9STRA|nr:hypothetical protein CTAYLR_004331 [Chrysophaeum taylorii]
MTLSADSRGPLGVLGILDACRALSCESRCHWTFDGQGRIRGYYGHRGGAGAAATGSLRVPRQEARRALLARYQHLGGRVSWGKRFLRHTEDENCVTAYFEDGSRCVAEVLVGADGHRSAVRPEELREVGISLVVGISSFRHPLLDRRGFYVVDGSYRLFTMPFSSDLTMWQLSGRRLGGLDDARDVVRNWVSVPVAAGLVDATKEEEVWASPLFDRDPVFDPRTASRVTVLGDAAHPMTCFKGQGANQALADAVTLGRCLSQKLTPPSLRRFEREMFQRAAPRVRASRDAALFLHSPAVLDLYDFNMVKDPDQRRRLVHRLDENGFSATSPDDPDDLEATVRDLIITTVL